MEACKTDQQIYQPESFVFSFQKMFSSYKNFVCRMVEVQEVNPVEQEVFTVKGYPSYDYLVLATQFFRMFPFTAPDYEWEDVDTGKDAVGFNYTRCRVAEYFKSLGLAELCYNTWCSLDYPLAEQWGGHLERSGSIAGGSKICDFRWKVNSSKSKT